jgi:hypothetical protein
VTSFISARKHLALIIPILFLLTMLAAQNPSQQSASGEKAQKDDYSGMYSFLQEGEFIQLSVEDAGQVTGFISRYGESESDRGAFIDHFIKQGKLSGTKLSFTTETAKGVSFDFNGGIVRGPGKTPAEDGYYLLKGVLIRHDAGADNKPTTKSQQVTFKSFPQDIDTTPDK